MSKLIDSFRRIGPSGVAMSPEDKMQCALSAVMYRLWNDNRITPGYRIEMLPYIKAELAHPENYMVGISVMIYERDQSDPREAGTLLVEELTP